MLLPPSAPADWADRFFDDGFAETFSMLGKYDSTEQNLRDIVALLALEPGARVLDVPCGSGRYAALLSALGYCVTGIDSSPTQIAHARRRCPALKLLQADMRQPPPGPFEAVLNLWTSFGYLATAGDDQDALAAWRRSLAPGGTLLMELTTLERAEHENRCGDALTNTKRLVYRGVTEDAWYDWQSQVAHVRYSRSGWSRVCRTQMYSRPQLQVALHRAGFDRVTFLGDFCGGPVAPANRTVVLASTTTNGSNFRA
ncbi:MAG: class I SAM-dependent methyltransferase [Pseudonocardiaceae bacterium]